MYIVARAHRSDRGATLLTFALFLIPILLVIALILGGSVGYEAERDSQTASDAAALAATSALRRVQSSGPSSVTDFEVVFSTADEVAKANGANEDESVLCELITADRSFIAECETATLPQFVRASGVRVAAGDTRNVPFGEIAARKEITGKTAAAATIQPLAQGTSPFMVCDSAYDDAGDRDIVILDTSTPDPDDYTINPASRGQVYFLQGEPIKDEGRDCAHPAASFRGWVDFDSTYPLPGKWGMEKGDKNGHIDPQLIDSDACGGQAEVDDFIGCTIAVPLCFTGSGGPDDFKLDCVAMGTFKIVWNGNGPSNVPADPDPETGGPAATCSTAPPKHICGRFIGGSVASEGQGSEEQAGIDDVVVIKLVE